jgi:regulator of sigma D
VQHRAAQHSIGTFLKNRQRLIVELMRLSNAIDRTQIEQSEIPCDTFCERLVDYLSNGYFRIFADESSPNGWATPREYAILESTTSTAMDFNDRRAHGRHVTRTKTKQELARVAFALETRFELEDEILQRSREQLALAS